MKNNFTVPFFGIKRQYAKLREELLETIDTVYSSGQVLDGSYTRYFERAIALRCERKYAIAVNSCSSAMFFILRSIWQQDDRILIPNISFAATVNSVLMANLQPRFCDTDWQGLIDIESVDYALTGAGINTVMYVNLFGNVVDYDRLLTQTKFFNEDMFIIEDAAQSFGASYNGVPSGKLGDVSVLSFDPTKNLPNYGSGGMILTDDLGVAENMFDLRDNGKHDGFNFPGTNSKMSESDCAQMLIKLAHFDKWQVRRKQIAEYYIKELSEYVDVLAPNDNVEHAWHKFVIRLSERHGLRTALAEQGIETKIHYEKCLSELPVSWDYAYNDAYGGFRESEAFTRECMSLPIYPELEDHEVEQIVEVIQTYLR
jgi:dTDP-4-amino-4,6-dideoxygalactose transaminase